MLPKLTTQDLASDYVGIVLAAGIGQRLGAMGRYRPKALLDFFGRPLLELTLDRLLALGCSRIVVNAHHLWWQIHDFIAQDRYQGKVFLSLEKNLLLGTGGGLSKIHAEHGAMKYLVVNADVVTDFPLFDLISEHEALESIATMALLPQPEPSEQPVWLAHNKVAGFAKDIAPNTGFAPKGFACIQALSAAFIEKIPHTCASGVIQHYRQAIAQDARIFGIERNALWWDLGSPERYERAHREFLATLKNSPEAGKAYCQSLGFANSADSPFAYA